MPTLSSEHSVPHFFFLLINKQDPALAKASRTIAYTPSTCIYLALHDHSCNCNSGMNQTVSVLRAQVTIRDQRALKLQLQAASKSPTGTENARGE